MMLTGGFLVSVGAPLLVIGLYWPDSSTASSAGQNDRSGVHVGLGLLGVGIAVILFGPFMLFREFQQSLKGYDSKEVGGAGGPPPSIWEPLSVSAGFTLSRGIRLSI